MNTKRYAISLSLALSLGVSTGTQASQPNHESEWSNVISYGNTTIAQDTPDDYGPWKMMVQPAAGPTGGQPTSSLPAQPLAHTTAPTPRPTITLPTQSNINATRSVGNATTSSGSGGTQQQSTGAGNGRPNRGAG